MGFVNFVSSLMQWIFLLVFCSFAERLLNWKKGFIIKPSNFVIESLLKGRCYIATTKKNFIKSILEKNIGRTIYIKVLSLADWLVSRYQETIQVTGNSHPVLSFIRLFSVTLEYVY